MGEGKEAREKLSLNGLSLSCLKSFVSCHLPGVTFTAVFCVAGDMVLGSLQSEHGVLHLLGISLISWKRVGEPNPQDSETPLTSLF